MKAAGQRKAKTWESRKRQGWQRSVAIAESRPKDITRRNMPSRNSKSARTS